VGDVVHRDRAEPLVRAGQQDRGSAPGAALDHPEPVAAVPDDHAYSSRRAPFARQAATMLPTPSASTSTKS